VVLQYYTFLSLHLLDDAICRCDNKRKKEKRQMRGIISARLNEGS
jgi:hypothetical protein